MRYDWVDQGVSSLSIGRGILLPEPVTELWVEIAIRFSENFTTCNPKKPPCSHKTVFLQVIPNGNLRWGLMFGAGGSIGPEAPFTMESPIIGSNPGTANGDIWERNHGRATDFMNGEWWLLRWHVKHSTTPDVADGIFEFMIVGEDGAVAESYSNLESGERFSTAAGQTIRAILLGRNKDKGLDIGTESMWIGRVRASTMDPGW
jgi:hypothetical protein